ncbi:hypothetical protein ACFQZE_20155 [Paenibacillus sp. GCM10027627]|uniref:hypothetical protein n=1 Tax=unclassified Paenibacillus TaxID=185978 RepID=UPI003630E14A
MGNMKAKSAILWSAAIAVTVMAGQGWGQGDSSASAARSQKAVLEVQQAGYGERLSSFHKERGVEASNIENDFSVYSNIDGDHRFSVAGIDDPGAFNVYLNALQHAVAANEKEAVAELFSYPFAVNQNGGTVQIESKEQFIQTYEDIMTVRVKEKLLSQKVESVFVNYYGVMIGDGEIWISQFDQKIAAYAINL